MRILVACEESQEVTKELRRLGHEAYSNDLIPAGGGYPDWHIQADALELIKIRWDMILAFPPCTHLCSSGQWLFARGRKDPALRDAAKEFFLSFARADCPRICIENPVGVMSTFYRKPDQIIQPWQFGETDSKRTCLWLKGLPKLKPTNIVPEELRTDNNYRAVFDGKHLRYSDPETARLRSRTYHGIAVAMAEQFAGPA